MDLDHARSGIQRCAGTFGRPAGARGFSPASLAAERNGLGVLCFAVFPWSPPPINLSASAIGVQLERLTRLRGRRRRLAVDSKLNPARNIGPPSPITSTGPNFKR